MKQTFLTGDKNVDSIILNNLNDSDLLNVRLTGVYGKELYDYDPLWYNRLKIKFPSFLSFYKDEKSWRKYYIRLLKSLIETLEKRDYVDVIYGDMSGIRKVPDDLNESFLKNLSQDRKNNALLWASFFGYLEIVKYLVQNGAHIYNEKHVENSLGIASGEGHLEVVKYLLQNGANIHIEGDDSLINAVSNGNTEVVKYLVENGANIHIEDDRTLRHAAEDGDLEMVKYLIQNGANININVLKGAVRYGGQLEILKYLVQNGADIHTDNEWILRAASMEGYLNIVKYLVENGADIHAENDQSLFYAKGRGHLDIVKYLLQNGANDRT